MSTPANIEEDISIVADILWQHTKAITRGLHGTEWAERVERAKTPETKAARQAEASAAYTAIWDDRHADIVQRFNNIRDYLKQVEARTA